MSNQHRSLAMLLALALLSGCVAPPTTRSTLAVPAKQAYVTGSRIALPVDPVTGQPQMAAPTLTVTQQELNETGQVDIGRALRQVLPELY